MPTALIVGMLVLATWAGPAFAEDRDASSIAEFVTAKDRWDRIVGRPLRLEGRYTVFSSTASELRFSRCDLKFVLTKSFRRPPTTTRNIEVAGQLVRNDGELEFRVTELKPRENDMDQLKRRRAVLDNSNADAVYQLADWAQQRARFYEDDELDAAANGLYREGLAIAEAHLKPNDAEGLRALAKQASEFGVDEGFGLRYLHHADRLEWEAAQAGTKKDYRRVIGLITRDLPGATSPIPPDRLAIRRDYETAPVAIYRVADAATRRLLARAFYLEVSLANILLSAKANGQNGDEIANRIERDTPELKVIAADYRQRELAYLTARLGRLTRTQMVDLSEGYKQQGQQKQSTDVIRDWLRAQEPRAAERGPTELMELGDEYINLLQDERSAARMYKQAYQQNAQLKTAIEWLTTHGYELQNRQWSKPGESDEEMVDASIDDAIAEGRVQVGMTGQQVLKTLGTQPSSSVRMVSAGEIVEVWVFKDYGITVRLQRRNAGRSAAVVEIGTID